MVGARAGAAAAGACQGGCGKPMAAARARAGPGAGLGCCAASLAVAKLEAGTGDRAGDRAGPGGGPNAVAGGSYHVCMLHRSWHAIVAVCLRADRCVLASVLLAWGLGGRPSKGGERASGAAASSMSGACNSLPLAFSPHLCCCCLPVLTLWPLLLTLLPWDRRAERPAAAIIASIAPIANPSSSSGHFCWPLLLSLLPCDRRAEAPAAATISSHPAPVAAASRA